MKPQTTIQRRMLSHRPAETGRVAAARSFSRLVNNAALDRMLLTTAYSLDLRHGMPELSAEYLAEDAQDLFVNGSVIGYKMRPVKIHRAAMHVRTPAPGFPHQQNTGGH